MISIEVVGGPHLKIFDAHEPDCKRILDNYGFVISGQRAQVTIAALQQGTAAIIRDVLRPWEVEPRGTFPLQSFKAGYDRAMQGNGEGALSPKSSR